MRSAKYSSSGRSISSLANDRAKTQARAFCAATRPGEEVARVVERAKGPNPPNSHGDDGDGIYHFYWVGMIYNAMDCEVTTKDGRVVSTKVVEDVD